MFGRSKTIDDANPSSGGDKSTRRINTEKFNGGRGSTTGQARSEKRSTGRIKTKALKCELGEVTDLSAGGIKIHCKRRPNVQVGDRRSITLKVEDESVQVSVLCMWLRVDDKCEFDLGMRIENPDPNLRRSLMALTTTAQASDGLSRGWSPMFSAGD